MINYFWCNIYPVGLVVFMGIVICSGLTSCELATNTPAYEKCMGDTVVLSYTYGERHNMCLTYAALQRGKS